MARGLIVGIDPGTTTGVAVLDLKGNLIGLKSKKNFPLAGVQGYLICFGNPLIVAGDVANPSDLVGAVAASFNSKKFFPVANISRREKIEIGKKFPGIKIKNWHERSALAAALYAYKSRENKLRQLERQLKERGLVEIVEEVKKEVIRGRSVARVLEGRP